MSNSKVPIDDSILLEKIRKTRAMRGEDRILAGPRLFDYACRIALDGLRRQFPDATDAELREILRKRLALARRIEGGA